jgi:hypothetical protein
MRAKAIRVVVALVATVLVAVAILAGLYGALLLATDDPDGGRHPVGAMCFGGSVVVGLVALGLIRAIRPRSAARASREKP